MGSQCRAPGTEACSNPGTLTCDGNTVLFCDIDGYLTKEDCAKTGEICFESTAAYCIYPMGTACTGHTCTDDGIVYCFDGILDRFEPCGPGLTCQLGPAPDLGEGGFGGADPNANLSYAYCGFDTACVNFDQPTCSGTELTGCFLGKLKTVDCASLGFASCTPGEGCDE
jgi:hypothetical protein